MRHIVAWQFVTYLKYKKLKMMIERAGIIKINPRQKGEY